MSLLVWGAMFEVGVAEIDKQHRNLFNLADSLAEANREGKGKELLEQIFTELIRYTQYHFTTEEQLMAQYGYKDIVQHKAKHQELASQVMEYRRAFAAGDKEIVDKMLHFFTNWLAHHIMETDKGVAEVINRK